MARREELFTTVTSQGGLLPPDLLARVAAGDRELPGLTADAYGLVANERIGEMANRSWNRLVGAWATFRPVVQARRPDEALGGPTRERWLQVLFQELGFGRLPQGRAVELDGHVYPVFTVWGDTVRVPLHLVGAGVDLDRRSAGVAGAARTSPHSLVQELLNTWDDALWGVVTNGLRLRLLRDNSTLTRQAFCEFDLEAMMDGEVYSDFALLWSLLHVTRFEGAKPADCWLERWRNVAERDGTRALEHLGQGVEQAIEALGQGFLAHPTNSGLRDSLQSGQLATQDYYRLVLRLVYRLLFLLVAEARDLLLSPDASPEARDRYLRYYSVERLRRLAEGRRGDRHDDLWAGLQVVMEALHESGQPVLGIRALGSLLWAPEAIGALGSCRLFNAALLRAVWALAFVTVGGGQARAVDYRNLGPEELGSVYEGLLELHPQMRLEPATFTLATESGNERKTTGSYYTPSSLIASLLDTALDPVLKEAARAPDPEAAILALRVVDPACGSGHFLLAAAQRIARRLAAVRTGDEEPSPAAMRTAVRDVIGHCLCAVDVNPMAVELCKVSLWIEALDSTRPLNFLDHRILCGHSLLGATPRLLAEGIPDSAFKPIEGDDKKIVATWRTDNRRERAGQGWLPFEGRAAALQASLAETVRAIGSTDDTSLAGIHSQEERFRSVLASPEQRRMRLEADAWCAAFVALKTRGQPVITDRWRRELADDPDSVPTFVRRRVEELARQYRFFHWHLAFPDVFRLPGPGETADNESTGWSGGFDLVLGNPPWDELTPAQKEFFARYQPDLPSLKRVDQDAAVAELLEIPEVRHTWEEHRRTRYATIHFLKASGRYQLFAPGNLGKGDFNVYRIFVEAALHLTRLGGSAAQLVPAGFYGGANAAAIRRELFEHWELSHVFGFINTNDSWFIGVATGTRFAAYVARKGSTTDRFRVAFELRSAGDLAEALAGEMTTLAVADIYEQSPDALAIPEVADPVDAAMVTRMSVRWPLFGDEAAGPPVRHYQRELDMTNDRDLFGDFANGLPVYEGRMVDQFDHRAKAYRSGRGRSAIWEELPFGDPRKAIIPQWRLPREMIPAKLGDRVWRYRVGWCDVTSPSNERSLLAALIPPGAICGNTVQTLDFPLEYQWAYSPWLAVANSFCLDYLARKKVALHVPTGVLDSLPFPRLPVDHPVMERLGRLALQLTCTGPETTAYWNAMAAHGWCDAVTEDATPPGLVDPLLRAVARAEIDAVVARDVFQLSGGELSLILDTFPVLRHREERIFGEFRTKRLILEHYDAIAESIATVHPYQTALD